MLRQFLYTQYRFTPLTKIQFIRNFITIPNPSGYEASEAIYLNDVSKKQLKIHIKCNENTYLNEAHVDYVGKNIGPAKFDIHFVPNTTIGMISPDLQGHCFRTYLIKKPGDNPVVVDSHTFTGEH